MNIATESLAAADAAALRNLLRSHGIARGAAKLGVAVRTALAAAAEQPVSRGTAALITNRLRVQTA